MAKSILVTSNGKSYYIATPQYERSSTFKVLLPVALKGLQLVGVVGLLWALYVGVALLG